MFLFQETMVEGKKALEFISSIFPSWIFCVQDSVGLSGGLVLAWNSGLEALSTSVLRCGIIIT